MTDAQNIADHFAMILRDNMTAADWQAMRLANRANVDSDLCASNDHCDANDAMDSAFTRAMGRIGGCSGDADSDIALVNEAWAIAKAESLTAPLTLSEGIAHVAERVARYSFRDEVIGAHWLKVTPDDDGTPLADHSCVAVYTLDGALWEVRLDAQGEVSGVLTESVDHCFAGYSTGYAAGEVDGRANGREAAGEEFELEGNWRLLAAAESALAFAQSESTWGAGSTDANGRAAIISQLTAAIAFAQ